LRPEKIRDFRHRFCAEILAKWLLTCADKAMKMILGYTSLSIFFVGTAKT